MREIKFRVWDNFNKRMYYQDEIIIILDKDEISTCFDTGGSYKEYESTQKDLEYMQYTGLKDKNGKEIYEGDIVRIEFYDYDSEDFIGTVCYDEAMYTVDKDRESYRLFDELDSNEVLGNIYENPELLNEH